MCNTVYISRQKNNKAKIYEVRNINQLSNRLKYGLLKKEVFINIKKYIVSNIN